MRRRPPARRVLRRARGCPYRATTRRVASPWMDSFVHESSCPASRRDRGWGAPAYPRWRSAARSLDRFSIAKVAAKCDPLLVRTAADLGENCGYVHSQALLGAAEKEQASEIPGSPVAALFRGRLGGRITLVECSRRGQPSFTRRALAVTGGSALAEEAGVTPWPPGLCPSGRIESRVDPCIDEVRFSHRGRRARVRPWAQRGDGRGRAPTRCMTYA